MAYTVTGGKQTVNWSAIGVAEILQNVAMIISTPKFTVPLRRDWFIDYSLLDKPMDLAKARLRAEIFAAIRTFEPRAEVLEIRFDQTADDVLRGRLTPIVVLEVPNAA